MNITVFGGTGAAGLLLLEKALSSGHKVTAFARTPAKVSILHQNLTVVQGELTESDKIIQVIKGADAVISLLGPKNNARELAISTGTKNILKAMQQTGVNRFIAAVSSSYRDRRDKFQFGFEFGVILLKVVGSNILKNLVETGDQISHSPLDWTLVRLPMLSDKPAKGNLKIGYTGDGQVNFFSLTREDLAEFLVGQLTDRTYLRQAPVISN